MEHNYRNYNRDYGKQATQKPNISTQPKYLTNTPTVYIKYFIKIYIVVYLTVPTLSQANFI